MLLSEEKTNMKYLPYSKALFDVLLSLTSYSSFAQKNDKTNVYKVGLSSSVGSFTDDEFNKGGFAKGGFYFGYQIKRHLAWKIGLMSNTVFSQQNMDEDAYAEEVGSFYNLTNPRYKGGPYRSLSSNQGIYIDVYEKNNFTISTQIGIGLAISYVEKQRFNWTDSSDPFGDTEKVEIVEEQFNLGFSTHFGATVVYKFDKEIGLGFDINITTINNTDAKLINPIGPNRNGISPQIFYLNTGISLLIY